MILIHVKICHKYSEPFSNLSQFLLSFVLIKKFENKTSRRAVEVEILTFAFNFLKNSYRLTKIASKWLFQSDVSLAEKSLETNGKLTLDFFKLNTKKGKWKVYFHIQEIVFYLQF